MTLKRLEPQPLLKRLEPLSYRCWGITKLKYVAHNMAQKTKVNQHKMVYDALEGKMGGVLHALSLTTLIPKN